ncbi:Alcohol dehydrogenase GroES domain protein [Thermoanaerobacterium thermosaccharolyticum DSM 571]|uniref:Alcohol dehydrogenase GroES domain protein n=1 Tax=Thermoanaerobacterium thermosaccharolyticum (strain ATCC 7956 / DSM 571 / NCIMB 9385 / NCA 3814 / NCTC 13789 / WDCM 00135 / 2032) TaxID=580327 RepID=D9TQJ5_THETC|nr:galactitol-1-phosphate 5-dehydrogenase [Thermoanaerobacterium thermosaccharolyticum]ADL69229.1 Alcohol dehydrogenase GroES domain protein [Thermoanaerobacterium thermosaccharolyticum DSM 571]TCW31997.1 L-iditol 2-dehydrogenase [Thermohydrogenium kirishiense]
MKAAVIKSKGVIIFENIEKPKPKQGEALIKIKACGVCGSDLPRIYRETYHYPLVAGHEMSGIVEEVGEDVDKSIIGKRVAIFPLIPCRKCASCETGNYAQCSNYNYLGSRTDGGMAEYVVAPIWNLCPFDDRVSFEEGAMIEPATVAQHALRNARIDIGSNVVIYGAGPIGLLVAKWAKISGATNVMMVDVDEMKIDFAKKVGFDLIINSGKEDPIKWIKDITKDGADIAVEASGSYKALQQCIESIKNFGKVILLGNPDSDMNIPLKLYSKILRKEATLKGSWNTVYTSLNKNEWKTTINTLESGRLKLSDLITHKVKIEDLPETIEKMHNKDIFYTKVLMIND